MHHFRLVRFFRLSGLLTLAIFLGLVLAACGDNTATPAPAATTAAASSATTAAAAATTAASSATTAAASSATTAAASSATTAAASSATTAAAAAAPTGGEIKIGIVSPFSGPLGFLGQYMANSAQIYVDKVNAQGGVLGKKLVLVTRDDELKPDKSVSATQDLLNNEKVSLLIGPSVTGNALATIQFVNEAKVIQMLPTVSGPGILDKAPYTFRMQQPDALQGVELAKFIAKEGRKKVAIIAIDNPTGKGLGQLLPGELKKNGVDMAGEPDYFKADEKDLSVRVQKAKDNGADAIIIGTGDASQGALIPKAMNQTGIKMPLYGIGGLEGGVYATAGGDAAIGTVFVDGYRGFPAKVPFDQQPKAYAEHLKAVVDKFGVDQTGREKGTPLTADCIMVWADAVKRAGSFDADKVKAEIEKTDLPADQTPSATKLKITPDNHESYREGSLYFYKWVKSPDGSYKFDEVK
jgi:branched-chain amino acid transport system substrate-binding protein